MFPTVVASANLHYPLPRLRGLHCTRASPQGAWPLTPRSASPRPRRGSGAQPNAHARSGQQQESLREVRSLLRDVLPCDRVTGRDTIR